MHAIVLAAGKGRRLGGAKHLLSVGGTPMLARVLGALARSRVRDVSVVLRADDTAGRSLAEGLGARVVALECAEEGRSASVRAGLAASPSDASGWLFALADQPFLESEDFDALLSAFAGREDAIVHASYAGERGTPVLFGRHYRQELLALQGREGGRVVIARHPEAVRAVALAPERGRDLDRPEDLATLGRAMSIERTLSIVKPDAIAAGHSGAILQKIEEAGLKIIGLRMLYLTRAQAEGFYDVHRARPFFKSLVEFMSSGPVVVSVLEGEDAIQRYRKLMGATNPAQADTGTLRKLYARDIERNAVHGSDGPDTARSEIAYFFGQADLVQR